MAEPEWISAAEAARRLGIKQATLYSYVSRGVLTRRRASAGPVPPKVLVVAGRANGQDADAHAAAARAAAVPSRRHAAAAAARAACSIPGRSRNWPAAAGRGARRAWPGW